MLGILNAVRIDSQQLTRNGWRRGRGEREEGGGRKERGRREEGENRKTGEVKRERKRRERMGEGGWGGRGRERRREGWRRKKRGEEMEEGNEQTVGSKSHSKCTASLTIPCRSGDLVCGRLTFTKRVECNYRARVRGVGKEVKHSDAEHSLPRPVEVQCACAETHTLHCIVAYATIGDCWDFPRYGDGLRSLCCDLEVAGGTGWLCVKWEGEGEREEEEKRKGNGRGSGREGRGWGRRCT